VNNVTYLMIYVTLEKNRSSPLLSLLMADYPALKTGPR
jgi:hypothetical protein